MERKSPQKYHWWNGSQSPLSEIREYYDSNKSELSPEEIKELEKIPPCKIERMNFD